MEVDFVHRDKIVYSFREEGISSFSMCRVQYVTLHFVLRDTKARKARGEHSVYGVQSYKVKWLTLYTYKFQCVFGHF